MRRRAFIAGLGGAAAWPMVALGQQPAMPVIGFLSARSPEESGDLVAGFRRGLDEEGYAEDKNVAIEYRWAEARFDRLPALATDLVGRRVAVVVAVTTPAALAAKATIASIPIVFVAGGDPVNLGLVAGLSRPGGNVTGVSVITFELLPKRLELIRDLVPDVTRIGLLINPTNAVADLLTRQVAEVANSLQRDIVVVRAAHQTEFDAAFASLVQQRAGALLVSPDPFFNGHSEELGALAARYAIPAIAEVRAFAAAGGLVSYGTIFADAYRQAGIYTGRILKGASPTNLPVMQATRVNLVINLKSAKALGLTIPLPLLGRADEVIE